MDNRNITVGGSAINKANFMMKSLNIDKASNKLDATQQKQVREAPVGVKSVGNWFSVNC